MDGLYRLLYITKGLILRRPLALCDIGDADGLTSAAIFLRKRPDGVVIFAAPRDVQSSKLLRSINWYFVADLPCPGKAFIRADHHRTNKPCAVHEFYDVEAPCSALMAMKALGLENDKITNELVNIAIQTDTASISTKEAEIVDLAVKGSNYMGRLYLARLLSRSGVEGLMRDERAQAWIGKAMEMKEKMLKIADSIPIREVLTIYFPRSEGISYRQLTIELQHRGAVFVNVLVRLGRNKYRLYCGANRDSKYDCTQVATKLGGGGHKFASGAEIKTPLLKPDTALETFKQVLESYLGSRIDLIVMNAEASH
ncbi:MAG: Fis family transcriptional regulator [Thermocladium sp.]